MSQIPGYFFGILSACAIFCMGRYLIAKPEKVARILAWGQLPIELSVSFFRFLGRFYCWLSVVAIVMLLGATAALFAH